jgi:Polysaccharide lyase
LQKRSRLVALSLAAATLAAPLGAHASVVWRGDFETGNRSQFNGKAQLVSEDRLQVVTSPTAQGRYALKATVVQGDNPISASGNRNELVHFGGEKEGDDFYYRFRVMFAPGFPAPNTWQLFTQWHHSGSSGSPPLEFVVRNERMELVHNTPSGTATRMTIGTLTRGVWHEFVIRIKWSSNASVGFVELWHDRSQVISRRYFPTLYAGQSVYMKAGLYRSNTIAPTGVLYLDDYVQATTFAEATGGTPAPAPTTPPVSEPDPDAPAAPGTGDEDPEAPVADGPPGAIPPQTNVDGLTEGEPLPQAGCAATGSSASLLGLLGLTGLAWRRRARSEG